MTGGRWLRDLRFSLALLGPLGGMRSIPVVPEQTVRDLWPGDAAKGERLVQGTASHDGEVRRLHAGHWSEPDWPEDFRDWLQGFEWLRDLRELGSDSARARARVLVASWIQQPIADTPLQNPAITGARIASWLSHYDFFAASADEPYRRALMHRVVLEARTLMALLPTDRHDWTVLQALKGLLAAAIAIPGQTGFLSRYMKLIDPELERQILPDGCHASRSPGAQLRVLRELAEMRLMLQSTRIPMPTSLASALDRMAPVLRAFRHGDGRLALFNGTCFHSPALIDLVIARAMPRGHVLARSMKDGRFGRAASGNTVLLVDGGSPAADYPDLAHAGFLSMELSSGRSQIVVNCGSSPKKGWHEALRDAPAHSVLSIPAFPPMTWRNDGQIETCPKVNYRHTMSDTDHLIELESDCYRPAGVETYHRRLFLAREGADLRGEDRLDCKGDTPEFVLRFHLHPLIRVELEETDILLHTHDEVWRFRSDGYSSIEESMYFGGPTPVATQQIVVRPAEIEPEQPAYEAPSSAEEATAEQTYVEDVSVQEEEIDSSPAESVSSDSKEPIASAPPSDEETHVEEPLSTEAEVREPELPPPPRLASAIRWAFTRLDE
ncbi:hypothetical protein AA0472_2256 [Acetobacter estunensis NRIC 0472]|uniref:Heparinase n=1 Tax=Acetobacter estunensis TaxID=104097 RepID=A0A967B6R3_9PROT|nr:heparinase II/III family protein [Acetobacter estunensis]NHO53923.1 heparinase [Acetobacter estunensis]GBQ26883.1 hypothetical protein AA0472_2256 [Acetobacter estunensis NRIC 0472]